jgi:hypothetical protein
MRAAEPPISKTLPIADPSKKPVQTPLPTRADAVAAGLLGAAGTGAAAVPRSRGRLIGIVAGCMLALVAIAAASWFALARTGGH